MRDEVLRDRVVAFVRRPVRQRHQRVGIDNRRIDRADLAAVEIEQFHEGAAALGIERLAQKGRETKRHFDELWATERSILDQADAIVASPASARSHQAKVDTLTAQEMEKQDDFRRETSSATDPDENAES